MKGTSINLAAIIAMTAFTNEGNRRITPSISKSVNTVLKAKGLKLFNIDGVEVWAINEKNAKRKAKSIQTQPTTNAQG